MYLTLYHWVRHWVLTGALYSTGIALGFLLVPFFTHGLSSVDEKYGVDLDEQYDRLFLTYKFVDEVDEMPTTEMCSEELAGLRDKPLTYEIPYLNQTVQMYYDHEKCAFCYYAHSNIIYKYLMVVARKYVLEYNCKQVFKEMVPSMKKEEKSVQFSAFVSKPGKVMLEKEMNQFLYLGNIPTPLILEKPKTINYSDYWKMCQVLSSQKLNAALDSNPVQDSDSESDSISSIPETQSTKID